MNEEIKPENMRIHSRADELIACLEGEIAKRDEELAACRVAVENCELFRARIAELEFELEVAKTDELSAAVWAATETIKHDLWDAQAELAALKAQEPVGWYTEDHLDDKSATTYSWTVAERWVAKGWPVFPLYAAPVPEAKAQGVVQWPNTDEIMQMAFEEGQPADDASGYYFELEEFDLFIERLMSEVARLNAAPIQQVSVPVACSCGREYPANSYSAGFISGSGMCEECDAAMPPKDIPQMVSVPDNEDWGVFFGYLIDKCEGHIVAEENLQGWLSEMLADPHYCALFRREKTAAEQYSPIAMSIEAAEEEHGSLRAAAKALGIDPGYLSRLKSGEKINPSAEILKALGLERITYYRSMLNAAPVQQDQAFCEYCGGNDEEPQDHCMDCTRPIQQVSVPDELAAFEREDRYIVIKRSDMDRIPNQKVVHSFLGALGELSAHSVRIPQRKFLVIESDWPEYDPAWKLIQDRVQGRPILDAAPAAPAADAGLVEALDYQALFDAIAAATSVYANGAVNISVQAFRDALAAHRAKGVV